MIIIMGEMRKNKGIRARYKIFSCTNRQFAADLRDPGNLPNRISPRKSKKPQDRSHGSLVCFKVNTLSDTADQGLFHYR